MVSDQNRFLTLDDLFLSVFLLFAFFYSFFSLLLNITENAAYIFLEVLFIGYVFLKILRGRSFISVNAFIFIVILSVLFGLLSFFIASDTVYSLFYGFSMLTKFIFIFVVLRGEFVSSFREALNKSPKSAIIRPSSIA
jgi:hypothetical protein